jgi:uroporphyrin-3 C-methyltransferase
VVVVAAVLTLLALVSLVMAWSAQQRVRALELELVRRAQDTQSQATEARVLAKEAHEMARDAAAKVALMESRVAENSLQRTQLEELLQMMSRSRDENLLADVDAALRVAVQQSALTGSTDALLTSLRQAEERIGRVSQPRLERVRRALAHDIERVRAVGSADISTLTIRLDEVVRLVDELPLVVQPERRQQGQPAPRPAAVASADAPASASALGWSQQFDRSWRAIASGVWDGVRSLVRVSEIDHPEAALLAPEQGYFVRANLRLRLLNARLSLLSRQFDTAQSDLRDAQSMLERYFDRNARRVGTAIELIKQVAAQARQVRLPRPDETLAAITAAQAGR